ncbi:hypothetical protein C8J27_10326 [Rhodobacter aestuarii]|uniref:Uncharacterized protein n=1 Tax=Rhodobacter aestuarii TaxID=453582 RepID=A0A1N7KGG5_9RHOB|nr:hypothetical protein [Rhodobacter aestuarii]PTV95699.1 hypothetical protein C8J27_10326 [Rhodobacter aestuarii]SIS60696.1 hypothetical protein SAMN05421580_102408 [Rhodobacter aestuarii]
MGPDNKSSLTEKLVELVAQADLSFWFVSGKGLGAVLLTLIAIVFLTRPKSSIAAIISAARAHFPRSK